jgi:HEAT repeat protein
MNMTGKVQDSGLEQIAKLLHKGDLLTRNQAAQAIGLVGPRAKDMFPALLSALSDPDPGVQSWVIWALGRMEGHALKAIPALEKLAADPKSPDGLKKAVKTSIEQIKKGKAAEK